MSGVLHPVGPEPEETYWLRRAIVAGGVLVLVIVVVALLVNNSAGSAEATAPAPSASQPAAPASETPSASASDESASPSPTPSSSGSPSSPSSSGSPSASESARASESPSASASASATAKPSGGSSPEASAKPTKKAAPAGPVSCAPAKLRATVTGEQRLKPAAKTTFRLSLINGSGATCTVSVTPEDFELKIYSGTDRIWSSADCATAVKPLAKKVAAEDAVTWSMTWNGRRSADGCRNRPEIPRAGTYFATAQLKGAEPVQLRMILRD